jgi:HEAT repeat protein
MGPRDREAIPALIPLLADARQKAREAAENAVKVLSGSERDLIGTYWDALTTSDDPAVRVRLVQRLGLIGLRAAHIAPQLDAVLRDTPFLVRITIEDEYGPLEERAVLNPMYVEIKTALRSMRADRHVEDRATDIEAYVGTLSHGHSESLEVATKALGQRAIPILKEFLAKTSPSRVQRLYGADYSLWGGRDEPNPLYDRAQKSLDKLLFR